MWESYELGCELIVKIDDELEREKNRYPETDWAEIARKAIRRYIRCREICEMYSSMIEKALSQEKY